MPDALVVEIIRNGEDYTDLSTSVKKQLLGIASVDTVFDDARSPLMVAA